MNLFIKSYAVLFACSLSVSAQVCNADVFIKTDVEDANLFVNDKLEGQGKTFELKLEPGTYEIRIIENYKKWNAARIDDTLKIIDCNSVSVTYTLQNKKLLDSNPQNVYVKESDSLIGFTPFLLENNNQTLLLQKPGYADKIVSSQEISTGIKPELQFTGEIKGESFYKSTMFKVLIGTLLTLGATTAYYKLEADKAFDHYQVTGDQAVLDQTNKYDLVSGVTFVAMQINFGLILYLFLTD